MSTRKVPKPSYWNKPMQFIIHIPSISSFPCYPTKFNSISSILLNNLISTIYQSPPATIASVSTHQHHFHLVSVATQSPTGTFLSKQSPTFRHDLSHPSALYTHKTMYYIASFTLQFQITPHFLPETSDVVIPSRFD